MATQMEGGELDLQEQLARIRQMGANTDKALLEMQKTRVDIDKVIRDTKVVTLATVFQGAIAIAALLGAGAAIAKLLFS